MVEKVSEVKEGTEAQTTPVAAQETNELKVVIQIKGTRAIISVGAPGCDPVIRMAETPAELENALEGMWQEVDTTIAQARAQWAQAKQYPTYKAPAPPPQPPVATRPKVATTAKRAPKGKPAPAPEELVQHGLPLL